MQKRIGRIALALWLILVLVPAVVLASGTRYVVVGDSGLCGGLWKPEKEENVMTANGDGTYSKVFTSVAVGDDYQLKVVEILETGDQLWHGDENDGNFIFNVTTACDVTVTFDPATKKITVSGDGVVMRTFPVVEYITAVGNGDPEYPSWLHGVAWDPCGSVNRMTKVAPGVYETTYTEVAEYTEYQVKFAANEK